MDTPSDLARSFSHALDSGDTSALEALCTQHGVSSRGESIGRLIRMRTREHLTWTPLAELVEEGRRASICGLLKNAKKGQLLGRLWLNARRAERWRLEGFTKQNRAAALFVAGVLPAIFRPEELPESEPAAAWAHQLLQRAKQGEDLEPLISEGLERLSYDTTGVLTLTASYQIAAIGRHVAGIGRRHGKEDIRQTTWFALERGAEGGMRVVGHRNGASAALLLNEPAG